MRTRDAGTQAMGQLLAWVVVLAVAAVLLAATARAVLWIAGT